MRAAHKPFNSPPEYRNKSNAGEVGDNIIELDDNGGKVLDRLDTHGITDNTVRASIRYFLPKNKSFTVKKGKCGHKANSSWKIRFESIVRSRKIYRIKPSKIELSVKNKTCTQRNFPLAQ